MATCAGHHAVTGAELCTIPRSLAGNDDVHEQVRAAVVVGTTRTMQQDVSYGLRQLTDVALRALSPSVNDPATAQEAVYHAAAVLDELLHRDPPAQVRGGPRGTWLVLSGRPSHAELVGLAFDEVRRAAAAQPGVCVDVLEALHVLHRSMAWDGLADRCPALEAQAHLLLAGAEAADLLPADLQAVRRAHAERFGPRAGGAGPGEASSA